MKEMSNNHRLELLGRAIHVERWKRPLAHDLGIDKRQVQRWAMGRNELRSSRSAAATSNGTDGTWMVTVNARA